MKIMKKAAALSAAAMLFALLGGCRDDRTREGGLITTADISAFLALQEPVLVPDEEEFSEDELTEEFYNLEFPESSVAVHDREGGIVTVTGEINRIISSAPQITEILSGLGLADKIVLADRFSEVVDGVDPGVCRIDFLDFYANELMAVNPDLIIVSGTSSSEGEDYAIFEDAGINVIYIPPARSLSDIKRDIEFIASCADAISEGETLVSGIDSAISAVSERAAGIADKKAVYFEAGISPNLYSYGSGTYIDEIITLIGGINVYGGIRGRISVSDESVIGRNPDVILTGAGYEGYNYAGILQRAGWEDITAVKNGDVYQINGGAAGRPSQNVTDVIYQAARAVYPEAYSDLG